MHTQAFLVAVVLLLAKAAESTPQLSQLLDRHRQLQAATALTNANIHAAVDACLAEDPEYMRCPNTQYGDAAGWDVSSVTDFADLMSTEGGRTGGAAASTQFVGGLVFADWDTSSATTTENSPH